MNTSSDNQSAKPKIIQAMLAGFNTIANKPILILFPVILDLFLWFGPAWRIDSFFRPFIEDLNSLPGLDSVEYSNLVMNFQSFWTDMTANIDLASALHTLPIGIPSLMVSKPPFSNPFGSSPVIYLSSSGQILGLWLIFILIGYLSGSLYYKNISTNIVNTGQKESIAQFFQTFFQVILMPFILLVILAILSIPVMFLLTLFLVISPTVGQFMLILIVIAVLWILLPLFFTPHGIFLYKQNLVPAMMTSISVVRTLMGETAWYILLSFLLLQGMNYLWLSPAVDNWFLLVGILGHAFVVTAIIASSFHYFLDATKYAQSIVNKSMKASP